jgi:hypothetical protein
VPEDRASGTLAVPRAGTGSQGAHCSLFSVQPFNVQPTCTSLLWVYSIGPQSSLSLIQPMTRASEPIRDSDTTGSIRHFSLLLILTVVSFRDPTMIPRLPVLFLNEEIFPVFDDRTPSRNLVRTDYTVNEIPLKFSRGTRV